MASKGLPIVHILWILWRKNHVWDHNAITKSMGKSESPRFWWFTFHLQLNQETHTSFLEVKCQSQYLHSGPVEQRRNPGTHGKEQYGLEVTTRESRCILRQKVWFGASASPSKLKNPWKNLRTHHAKGLFSGMSTLSPKERERLAQVQTASDRVWLRTLSYQTRLLRTLLFCSPSVYFLGISSLSNYAQGCSRSCYSPSK